MHIKKRRTKKMDKFRSHFLFPMFHSITIYTITAIILYVCVFLSDILNIAGRREVGFDYGLVHTLVILLLLMELGIFLYKVMSLFIKRLNRRK